jgi:predicted outer membrane protein
MSQLGIHQAINRLLTIVFRSLPMYLTFACPWTHRGDEKAVATLARIVEDQKQLANRIAQFILERHDTIEMGEYPADFPDTHDLSLDYLITKLIQRQKNDVSALERCVAELQQDRQAAALAEEALGSARGHLESLEELAGEVAR